MGRLGCVVFLALWLAHVQGSTGLSFKTDPSLDKHVMPFDIVELDCEVTVGIRIQIPSMENS